MGRILKNRKRKLPKEKSAPKETYETIKVCAKGGVITLTFEETDKSYFSEETKNRLRKNVYGKQKTNQLNSSRSYAHAHSTSTSTSPQYSTNTERSGFERSKSGGSTTDGYKSDAYLEQHRLERHQHSANDHNSNQIAQDSHQRYSNRSYDEIVQTAVSNLTAVKQGDTRVPSEYVYYTVCTRYFQPQYNDWIHNIHRMGRVKVPSKGEHHQKCVFWHQLYEPDREDITVQKLVPPPKLKREQQYKRPDLGSDGEVNDDYEPRYEENNNSEDSWEKALNKSYDERINAKNRSQKRS